MPESWGPGPGGAVDRRAFTRLGLCGAATALAMARPDRAQGRSPGVFTRYSRVLLTRADGGPIRAGDLDEEEEYLFFYPFVSTPCLLLDLGRPLPGVQVPLRGSPGYAWEGGVGPKRSVVAFTAICPHEWSHPEKRFSPIGYHRTGERAAVTGGRDRLIVCCAHGSAFDPAAGGWVEQAPAEIPLAAVALSWDRERDRFVAEGMLGPDSFERFFGGFRGKSRTPTEGRTLVMRLRDYSAVVARC